MELASCADWLAWRCGIGLSAAREKVRIAHALKDLPAISAAFEQGRVSYSKVRALTRTVNALNERELLDYALHATAPQVEERCRQIRNVRPESVEEAKRAWKRRSMSVFRNPSRGTMTISNTLLLCTHHHRLVHEGGLRVRRATNGSVELRRADGRAIPRCGYRAEDAAPDRAVLDGSAYSSMEAWLAALVSGRRPHAGVREEAAGYR